MESKYYTPDIAEFYVGFEYEQIEIVGKSGYYEQDWVNTICTAGFGTFDEDIGDLNDGYIRVKYLDREDIESLGFIAKYKDREKENMYYMNPAISLWFVEHMSLIRIVAPNGRNFTGIIKNKSELKKLLIQLSILEDGE